MTLGDGPKMLPIGVKSLNFRQLIFSRVKNDKVCEKFHLSKLESHQHLTIINFIKMKLILVSIGAVLGEQCYEVVVILRP